MKIIIDRWRRLSCCMATAAAVTTGWLAAESRKYRVCITWQLQCRQGKTVFTWIRREPEGHMPHLWVRSLLRICKRLSALPWKLRIPSWGAYPWEDLAPCTRGFCIRRITQRLLLFRPHWSCMRLWKWKKASAMLWLTMITIKPHSESRKSWQWAKIIRNILSDSAERGESPFSLFLWPVELRTFYWKITGAFMSSWKRRA